MCVGTARRIVAAIVMLVSFDQAVAAKTPASVTTGQETPEVELGTWYCVGPLKDEALGLHRESFAHIFPPEQQAIETGEEALDLNVSWEVEDFATGKLETRRWVEQPQWVDGYLNYLPFGPPPMRNETCYLYRTITTAEPITVEMRIYALDNIRAWLNGSVVGQATNPDRGGSSRFAAALLKRVELKKGENRLLVKITSMHGKRGFSFAMPPYTPSHSFLPGQTIESIAPADDAISQVRDFRFAVTPIAMYDPAQLPMDECLARSVPGSPAGNAYLDRLTRLQADIREAAKLAKSPSADKDEPTIAQAAKKIGAFWAKEICSLGRVAFIECPSYQVNAIAPISSRGGKPARIRVWDSAKPQEPPEIIFHDRDMSIFDMNVSYDGETLFFSAAGKATGGCHIYEIGVDGKNLRQITDGPCSDIMPLLLPSGEIMFVSDRADTRVVCQNQPSGVLYVCNRDGGNVRRVSGNTLSDHTPQIMDDGRVLFTRWDYGVDKNVFCRQNLWTMNPDGTRFQLFGSNTKEDPNAFWKARPIAGRPEVVCVFGPHHTNQVGMIGLVWDRATGHHRDLRGEGFRWITRELPTYADLTLQWGYRDPYPIHEHLFLVSYGGDGQEKNRLYLLDDRGNRKMIHEAEGALSCFYPIALRTRRRPPVLAPLSDNPGYVYEDPFAANAIPDETLQGTFLVQNVYEGIGSKVKRGEVKALQIMEQVPKTQYVGSDHQGYAPAIGRGTMYVRRILGTVPVEADGSAHFVAPAIRDISLNALDSEGRVVRHMGATIHIMPGEKINCVGCHEGRKTTTRAADVLSIAAQRAPSIPHYPTWTEEGILDFNTVVQPVLDKYCTECHSGPTPDAALDLSGDKTRFFSMAYDSLLDRGVVDYCNLAGTDHDERTAKDRGSVISRIEAYLSHEHCGQTVVAEDRRRLYTWIDASVPYYGTYTVVDKRGIGARDRWLRAANGWFEEGFDPVFQKRCVGCHKHTVTPQTYNYNPSPDTVVTSRVWNDQALSQFHFGHYRSAFYGPDYRINLTHPEWSQMLTAPLSKEAGGMQLCQAEEGGAVFKDTADPDYQTMLAALMAGQEALSRNPRVDMPETLRTRRMVVGPTSGRIEFTFKRDNWISQDATYESSSIDPRYSDDMDKLLTGEPFDRHWSVCTKEEPNPWLVITLPEESTIAEVDIVNRFPDCREFARTLTMWLSTDKNNWTEVWRAPRVEDRWLVDLPEKPRARYIKLGLHETQFLDLKYVFVYGTTD